MKYRILTKTIKRAIKTFPAIVVTGPRQSGKTTLLKSLFSKTHTYVNLENPDVRMRASSDPIAFLDNITLPVIIDEIQYVPELLPYIKSRIDDNRKSGQWLLTGSQNFTLMHGVSESLAGRVAVLSLLPFTYSEREDRGKESVSVEKLITKKHQKKTQTNKHSLSETILRGSFPEIASNSDVDRQLWCGSYITTYLERDIRNLAHVGDLGQFEQFLRLCATRTGHILNVSELARDIGVSVPTAKRWLSLLETGYQIYLLYPYYKNIGKRIVKSPKLYFNDTALASYLLGLHDKDTLLASPHFPHLFETFIVTDFWKRHLHFGALPSQYYVRTRDGLEIDLVVEQNQKLNLFEIKSSSTITLRHTTQLTKAKKDFGAQVDTLAIVSQSPESFKITQEVMNYNWQDLLS